MRVDKFLKLSRIIKRRTVCKAACEAGRVLVNGKVAKPSTQVEPSSEITVSFGGRVQTVRVEATPEHVTKNEASSLYTIIK